MYNFNNGEKMEFLSASLNFLAALASLLVIYAAYDLVKSAKHAFAQPFKIIVIGHFPSTVAYFLATLIDIGTISKEFSDEIMFFVYVGQVLGIFFLLIAIIQVRKILFEKVEKFLERGKK